MQSKIDVSKISAECLVELARKVCGPSSRTLDGQERDDVWLILMLAEPVRVSNNQRSITEIYMLGDLEYHIHYCIENTPIIEQISRE